MSSSSQPTRPTSAWQRWVVVPAGRECVVVVDDPDEALHSAAGHCRERAGQPSVSVVVEEFGQVDARADPDAPVGQADDHKAASGMESHQVRHDLRQVGGAADLQQRRLLRGGSSPARYGLIGHAVERGRTMRLPAAVRAELWMTTRAVDPSAQIVGTTCSGQ